jgi:hypothetical protein
VADAPLGGVDALLGNAPVLGGTNTFECEALSLSGLQASAVVEYMACVSFYSRSEAMSSCELHEGAVSRGQVASLLSPSCRRKRAATPPPGPLLASLKPKFHPQSSARYLKACAQ